MTEDVRQGLVDSRFKGSKLSHEGQKLFRGDTPVAEGLLQRSRWPTWCCGVLTADRMLRLYDGSSMHESMHEFTHNRNLSGSLEPPGCIWLSRAGSDEGLPFEWVQMNGPTRVATYERIVQLYMAQLREAQQGLHTMQKSTSLSITASCRTKIHYIEGRPDVSRCRWGQLVMQAFGSGEVLC
ncbi:hypothetical protein P280DRAFT_323832 [Massarina eburnea CBS 473.64]|uniref:Uncharacterized protein n=1 Tax=Massarina eburnea CBS 473.64 TaxID=1395130 RepID=A0A6A6S345_9PLEO|nr:hypothetical protein P280DRAFT_323832 [Massarina eburnea CBS 473.64]